MSTDSSPSEFVTLASNDGFEFIIPREAANISGTLRRMLGANSNFSEAVTGRCVLENMKSVPPKSPPSGVILEKVCEYFLYHLKHKGQADVPDMEIPPELCLELLMAADYLDSCVTAHPLPSFSFDDEDEDDFTSFLYKVDASAEGGAE
ncbi:elongin C [Ophidiomyces ophidiicola]|nr:elongin C [Ophidiomyces ophidiicola]KAI1994427.1 elongin C [Ophidiomyces ophidiicola]KAI1994967.1 elongin C [Ophidiomyces ophidiicola]KAI1997822.1 elongin C [Ophidiomyces ophidiicola]